MPADREVLRYYLHQKYAGRSIDVVVRDWARLELLLTWKRRQNALHGFGGKLGRLARPATSPVGARTKHQQRTS